jgi:hypothetical protein
MLFGMAIALLGALLSPNAYAWGHLLSLSQGAAGATLTSTSLKTHTIHFCISGDFGDTAIDATSIEGQVRLVIGLWLQPVRELIGDDVSIDRVDCEDKRLNLKVTFGVDTRLDKPAITFARFDGGRHYEEIFIRTNYRIVVPGQSYPLADFAWIVKRFNPHTGHAFTMPELLDYAEQHRLSSFDVGRMAGVNGLVSFNSSFNILLHEIGHAFGLCDMYLPAMTESCDMNHVSHPINAYSSIMREGGQLSLQQDDRDGVKSLFERYISLNRKPKKGSGAMRAAYDLRQEVATE